MAEMMDNKGTQGVVLRFKRGAVHDGDGIRTVVFLKGCPLSCQWCSTPESQAFHIEKTEQNVYGQVMTVEEVMSVVRKDTAFFFHSGGGVTLSGGEVLSQHEFAKSILKASKRECINTAIETSFYGPWSAIQGIAPYVNSAYIDMKFYSDDLHKQFCGAGNELIKKNLIQTNFLDNAMRMIIRIPIIPGINDSNHELEQIGRFCSELKHLTRVELLPYHRYGIDTYRKLGREYLLKDIKTPSEEEMLKHRLLLRRYVEHVV